MAASWLMLGVATAVIGCVSKNATDGKGEHPLTIEDREHQMTDEDRMIARGKPVHFPAEPPPAGYRRGTDGAEPAGAAPEK